MRADITSAQQTRHPGFIPRDDESEGLGPLLLDAVLQPNRSLSKSGFYLLMGVTSLIVLVSGAVFVTMGAWPVFGFLGLDIVLLLVAFALSYRAGRLTEHVRVSATHVVLERIFPNKRRQVWRFNPLWARVEIADAGEAKVQVTLRGHGHELVLGSFLAPAERESFARALERALSEARSTQPLTGAGDGI